MHATDSEIIVKIRLGAKQPFAILVDRYRDSAMTLALRMLRNREDAEEATQDAFVRAFRSLGTFEGAAKFSTWFYRIVYNVCLTRLGNRKKELTSVEFDDEREIDSGNAPPAPDAELEVRDMATLVRKSIERLPPKYSAIISLFYVQELSHEEICEVTQLPRGTVKVRLHRARALLQESLRKELHMEKVAV